MTWSRWRGVSPALVECTWFEKSVRMGVQPEKRRVRRTRGASSTAGTFKNPILHCASPSGRKLPLGPSKEGWVLVHTSGSSSRTRSGFGIPGTSPQAILSSSKARSTNAETVDNAKPSGVTSKTPEGPRFRVVFHVPCFFSQKNRKQ